MYAVFLMSPPNSPQEHNSPVPQSPSELNPRKEIPLVSVPADCDLIAEEMAELFDEDKVTHQHGSSEPEAD